MYDKRVVNDNLGQSYIIKNKLNPKIRGKLSQKEFLDQHHARIFFTRLDASKEYWQGLLDDIGYATSPMLSEEDFVGVVCDRLVGGQLKVFNVASANSECSPDNRKFVNGETIYQFDKADIQLYEDLEVMHFNSEKEASELINKLALDDEKLATIAKDLNIPVSLNNGSGGVGGAIAKSIAKGEMVVVEKMKTSATPVDDVVEETAAAAAAQAGLGSEDASESEEAAEECSCSITTFTARAGKRKNNKNNVLQIAPAPKTSASSSIELLGMNITLKEQYGGVGKVRFGVGLMNRKAEDCYKIIDKDGAVTAENKLVAEEQGTENKSESKWLLNATPEKIIYKGHGCDGNKKEITIEKYPNNTFSVESGLKIFDVWVDGVNKGWKKWGETLFNISPIEIKPELEAPKGEFSASWGWKEDEDWRVYYDVAAEFGLKPMLGIKFAVDVSMVKLAASYVGIPPVLSEFASNHIADLKLGVEVGTKATLTGSPHAKFYTDDTTVFDGEGKFGVVGGIDLRGLVRAGTDYIRSWEVITSAGAEVEGNDTVSLDKSGAYLQTTITLLPLVGKVNVKRRTFKVHVRETEKKWEPWDKIEIYKSDKKKLFPEE